MQIRARTFALALLTIGAIVSCRSKPKTEAPPPPPLGDAAAAALRWVDATHTTFQPSDSVASPAERRKIIEIAGNARIIGFSELTEGTHEFAYVMRRALFTLADSSRVRGIAIQAPMAEAMLLDRYVRTGRGDVVRAMRGLGSWRWQTREMRALIDALREYNQNRQAADQIGFYGFEIPSAALAVNLITTLPDSVVGAPLKAWLTRQYACVAINEGAQWGREGRSSDSSYWTACGPATKTALDSVSALRARATVRSADVAFAEQMAKMVAHHVRIGLRHLKREEFNAEHVMFLADLVGENNRLMLWGGDVEMARLTLDGNTVQTAVTLNTKIAGQYRAIGFAFGNGVVRARNMSTVPRGGGEIGLSDITVRPPLPDTFEDVFARASGAGWWADMRGLPDDPGGNWLRGPRPMRLIIERYSTVAPESFQTPMEFPKFLDAVVFVKTVTPAKQ
jgi:erythromycin esterase-like protein